MWMTCLSPGTIDPPSPASREPTPTITSASLKYCPAGVLELAPRFSPKANGLDHVIADLPLRVVNTPAWSASASSTSASCALPSPTPPPAMMTGFLALISISAAASIRAESAAGRIATLGSSRTASPCSSMVSGGTSISTGRGRPVLSWYTASCTAAGISPTCRARLRHLVTGSISVSWSFTSCSMPTSLPMKSRCTWPEIMKTGEETE